MAISGVAHAATARLEQMIYLDAFLPVDGKALKDYAPVPPTRADGWRIPPPSDAEGFGVVDETDAAWVDARLGDHPLRTFTQAVRMTSDVAGIKQSFIQCSKAPFFAAAALHAKETGFAARLLLVAGHDAMISKPKELSKMLMSLL